MRPKEKGSLGGESQNAPQGRMGASFVMTLWLEPTEGGAQPEWRWRVVEVRTGAQRYFRRLADLMA